MDLTNSVTKMFSALNSLQGTRDSVASAAVTNGLNLMQNKKYKEAAAAFRQATAMKPDYVDAYNMLGSAYQKLGQTKDAVNAYVISLKLDKSQASVHTTLANIYVDQKEYTKAQAAFKAASQADPTDPVPHYTLGLLLQQMGNSKDAEVAFQKTVRLSPNDGNAYYGLATAQKALGQTDAAISNLKKAMQLKRGFVAAMSELGQIYVSLSQDDKAQEQIDALKLLGTDQATAFANGLAEALRKPMITGKVADQSTLNTNMGTTSLIALDPTVFVKPGAVKEFSMTFQFDTSMDSSSVTNVANWKIGRSSGGTSGLYDNGLYRSTDRAAFIMPSKITYNPVSQQATVYFPIYQNDDLSGTIDTSRLTFKFMGVDQNGKAMDTSADEYNDWAKKAF